MDLRALVTTGFWPAMAASCSTEASMILPLLIASPSPMFTTIFSRRGACIGFANPNSFMSAARTSPSYLVLSRAAIVLLLAFGRLLRAPGDAWGCLPRGLPLLEPRLLLRAELPLDLLAAHRLLALPEHEHVRDGDRPRLLDDPALRVRLAAPLLRV